MSLDNDSTRVQQAFKALAEYLPDDILWSELEKRGYTVTITPPEIEV
jgi:hypothetical protein